MDGSASARPWEAHRPRVEALSVRYPFAAEMLTLYRALLDVWDEGWALAHDDRPEPAELPQWTVERVLPGVVKTTEAAGPAALVMATRDRMAAGGLAGPLAAWLAGEELPAVERFLARAALYPALAAGDAGAACAADPSPRAGRRCPRCGGLPQVSFRRAADDALVTGRRHLVCVRCGHQWAWSASACPSCGETTGSKRTVYAEHHDGPVVGRADGPSTFPQLRVEACTACQRYVIDVDLGRDPAAVAEVDELAAVPLALYAAERGHTKLTANLMGV
jgi:FdhE protein